MTTSPDESISHAEDAGTCEHECRFCAAITDIQYGIPPSFEKLKQRKDLKGRKGLNGWKVSLFHGACDNATPIQKATSSTNVTSAAIYVYHTSGEYAEAWRRATGEKIDTVYFMVQSLRI